MGKYIVCFILALIITICSVAQSLEGEWTGSFKVNTAINTGDTKIKLIFVKFNDSVYQAFSTTYLSNTDSVVCILKGGFIRKKELVLEEFKTIKPSGNSGTEVCLQTMQLVYSENKKRFALRGHWVTEDNKCGSGEISVYKVK